jgi:nucleotide-binding universal stress UspA family protein
MFEKVLLAVDGSEHSAKAVPVAVDIAKKSNGEVLVYHVREHVTGKGGRWELEEAAHAEELVERICSEVAAAGPKAKARVDQALTGHVAQAIVDAAVAEGVDLVVMGSRGLSDLRGLMLGSVTHKVIQFSIGPVLVAR